MAGSDKCTSLQSCSVTWDAKRFKLVATVCDHKIKKRIEYIISGQSQNKLACLVLRSYADVIFINNLVTDALAKISCSVCPQQAFYV